MVIEKRFTSQVVNNLLLENITNFGLFFIILTFLKFNRRDYVSILLQTLDENLNTENDEKSSKEFETSSIEKKMTLEEIKLNLVGFLIAGFDTVSSAINYSMYVLATHPEQLTRLQEEVDANFENTVG